MVNPVGVPEGHSVCLAVWATMHGVPGSEPAVPTLSRRNALFAGVTTLTGSVVLLATGCRWGGESGPDPLLALVADAHRDAMAAKDIATKFPGVDGAAEVATARAAQAVALQREIDRARGATTSATPSVTPAVERSQGTTATDRANAVRDLARSLDSGGRRAAALVPTLPRYRAGLVGSVAAGCASLAEVLAP